MFSWNFQLKAKICVIIYEFLMSHKHPSLRRPTVGQKITVVNNSVTNCGAFRGGGWKDGWTVVAQKISPIRLFFSLFLVVCSSSEKDGPVSPFGRVSFYSHSYLTTTDG